jgi:predicted ATP-dependent protease
MYVISKSDSNLLWKTSLYATSIKLLASKIGTAFANKKLLSASIIASLVVAVIGSMSVELAHQSTIIDQQTQEIPQYTTTIATQKQEIADKTDQLRKLDQQIDIMSSEIVLKEEEIVTKSHEAESLRTELAAKEGDLKELQTQFQSIQGDIGLLQAKIKSNEQYIAELTHQMAVGHQGERVRVSHYGLGVTEDNKVIVFPIEVEIIPSGSGSLSVDVSNVQYETSFQSAVRTAAAVASDYTGVSISQKDIIVRFVNNLDDSDELVKVDGPSAGSIITAMIIAGLSDEDLNPSILVTGTIKPDGSVGSVGSVEDKIDAAAAFGASIMLVPKYQEPQSSHILVIGVSNIDDVMKYLAVS